MDFGEEGVGWNIDWDRVRGAADKGVGGMEICTRSYSAGSARYNSCGVPRVFLRVNQSGSTNNVHYVLELRLNRYVHTTLRATTLLIPSALSNREMT